MYTFIQFRNCLRDECVLKEASKELQDTDLLDLFGISDVDLSDEDIDHFGEKDYILYRVEKELNVQFNTRKQLVLKTLYAYTARGGNLHDTEALSMFGTNNFNLIWESVCADIMNNRLNAALGSLPLPVPLKEGYDKRQKLIDIIEKTILVCHRNDSGRHIDSRPDRHFRKSVHYF